MGSTMPELQRSFSAKTKDGAVHQLELWAPVERYHTQEGHRENVGSATIQMADGTILNRLDKGHYRLAGPDIEFWSDDPNAP